MPPRSRRLPAGHRAVGAAGQSMGQQGAGDLGSLGGAGFAGEGDLLAFPFCALAQGVRFRRPVFVSLRQRIFSVCKDTDAATQTVMVRSCPRAGIRCRACAAGAHAADEWASNQRVACALGDTRPNVVGLVRRRAVCLQPWLGAWAVEHSVSKFAYKLIKTEPPTQFLRRL
jgi:hypothetical protein